jgi:hypothetical protein
MARDQLLKPRLVVLPARPLTRAHDAIAEQIHHEPLRFGPSALEVHRAEYGLERVGEDRRLLPAAGRGFALAEEQRLTQLETGSDLRQGGGAHDRGSDLGQLTFGQLGELVVDEVGDDEAENGVAQEFETLVGLVAGVLGTPRAVRERAGEVGFVGERPAEAFVERGEPSDRRRVRDS